MDRILALLPRLQSFVGTVLQCTTENHVSVLVLFVEKKEGNRKEKRKALSRLQSLINNFELNVYFKRNNHIICYNSTVIVFIDTIDEPVCLSRQHICPSPHETRRTLFFFSSESVFFYPKNIQFPRKLRTP